MLKQLLSLLKHILYKFKIIYFITFISIISLFIELFAMMLLSGLSNGSYKIFNTFLLSLDKEIVFISIITFFAIRFILLLYIEIKKIAIRIDVQTFLTLKMFKRFLQSNIEYIEQQSIGKFIVATGDEASRASIVFNSFFALFITLLSIALYTIMVIYLEPNMSYVLIIYIVFILYIFNHFLKLTKKNSGRLIPEGVYVNSLLMDAMNGIRIIKSFGMSKFTYEKYKKALEIYQKLNFKTEYYSIINKFLSVVLIIILYDIYILYIYHIEKAIDILFQTTLFLILLRLLSFFGDLLHQVNKMLVNLEGSENLVNELSKKIIKNESSKSISKVKQIQFKNICFKYQNMELELFQNFSLKFNNAKSYAIVGKSGTGKSTLIDLLMDFKQPQKGEVLINEIVSTELDENVLSNKIVYVGQESIIFNDTIRNNMSLNNDYTDEDLYNVLDILDLKNDVLSLDNCLEYTLQYKGSNISGGQQQRINIARALLKEPDVLILDESVNALNSEMRIQIVKQLIKIYSQKIIIFVTHDKDILDQVDIIVDLNQLQEGRS